MKLDIVDLGDWAGAVVALMGLTFVVAQVRVQRGQHRLQEADAHRQQAERWSQLEPDWQNAVIAAMGSRAGSWAGIPGSRVKEFMRAVERYREAKIAFLEIQEEATFSGDAWDKYLADIDKAEEDLGPYNKSVQRIILHLAQVSGLVLRGRLSLNVAYDAMGPQLVRIDESIRNLMREGYANNSGCVAPEMMELYLWKKMDAEQVVERIGWGDFLDVARGTAERVSLFLDLLTMHAIAVGDLELYSRGDPDYVPGMCFADKDRLSIIWRGARQNGNLIRTARITRRFSMAGRRSKRRWASCYPDWLEGLLDRIKPERDPLPVNGWIRAPLDFLASYGDVLIAARRSRRAKDVRRPEEPNKLAERLDADYLDPETL